MDETSITSLKTAFIRTQVRHLDAPLEISDSLSSSSSSAPTLSAKVQTELIARVNHKIRQHNRLLFSTQSQRHIAEQIESLHWNLVEAETESAEIDTVGIRRDADLTDSQAIRALPDELEDLCLHADHEAQEDQVERYARLRTDLAQLAEKRDAQKKKLAQYRHLKTLIAPLKEPQKTVQPHLVTRDGEMSQELDRMRILLARVAGRVDQMQKPNDSHRSGIPIGAPVQTDQQKLARVMELG